MLYPYLFPLKGYLERSYVSATKIENRDKVAVINVGDKTKSLRYYSFKEDNYGFNIPYTQRSLFNYFPKIDAPLFNAPITKHFFNILDNILLLYNEKKSKGTK